MQWYHSVVSAALPARKGLKSRRMSICLSDHPYKTKVTVAMVMSQLIEAIKLVPMCFEIAVMAYSSKTERESKCVLC
jgi:hypothetical protein